MEILITKADWEVSSLPVVAFVELAAAADYDGTVIHEVAFEQYLKQHAHPHAIEFYLCGPPQMMMACQKMLRELGVNDAQITCDEF